MTNAAIQDFWTAFSQRVDALAKLESAEDPVYDEVLAKLHAINDALFLENLRRYVAGEPLANEADPKDVLAGG